MRTFASKNIPSCDETGWTHKKILNLINYPDDVAAKMEEHSVHIYDPRWPIDNSWIPPRSPTPGRSSRSWPRNRRAGGGRQASRQDRRQERDHPEFDDEEEADAFEYLAGASEEKLQRAVDIGEEDQDDDDGFRTPGRIDAVDDD